MANLKIDNKDKKWFPILDARILRVSEVILYDCTSHWSALAVRVYDANSNKLIEAYPLSHFHLGRSSNSSAPNAEYFRAKEHNDIIIPDHVHKLRFELEDVITLDWQNGFEAHYEVGFDLFKN